MPKLKCTNPACGAVAEEGRFCGECRSPLAPTQEEATMSQIQPTDKLEGFAKWNLPIGAVGLKINYKNLAGFAGADGVVVEEGTQAIVLVDGAVAAVTGPGRFEFKDADKKGLGSQILEKVSSLFGSLFSGKTPGKDGVVQLGTVQIIPKKIKDFSVILCRTADFDASVPLTSSKGDDAIFTDASLKVEDPVAFYKAFLLDREAVTADDLGKILGKKLGDRGHESVYGAKSLSEVDTSLRNAWNSGVKNTGIALVALISVAKASEKKTAAQRVEARDLEEKLKTQASLWSLRNREIQGEELGKEDREKILQDIRKTKLLREEDEKILQTELSKAGKLRDRLLLDAVEKLEQRLKDENEDATFRLKEKMATREASLGIALEEIKAVGAASIRSKTRHIERHTEEQDVDVAIRMRDKNVDSLHRQKKQELELEESKKDADHKRNMEEKLATQQFALRKLEIFKDYASPAQILAANPEVSSDAASSLAEMFKSSKENDALKDQINMMLKKSDSERDFVREMLKYQKEMVIGTEERARKKTKEAEDSASKQVRNAATLAGKLKATDRMDAKAEDEDSGQRKMSEGDEESGT